MKLDYNISNLALDPVVNFGKVTVSTGYTSTDTTIVLNTEEGTKLPDPSLGCSFNIVWYNSSDYPDPADDPKVYKYRYNQDINIEKR